jgi:hypothetical protein
MVGLWKQLLPAQEATTVGRNIKLTAGISSVTLEDVVFGEVLFCSGHTAAHIFLDQLIDLRLPCL